MAKDDFKSLNPRPTGSINGSDLPNRGVRTGVTDTYGGNLDQGYNNAGSITGDTKSDPAAQDKSQDQYVNKQETD